MTEVNERKYPLKINGCRQLWVLKSAINVERRLQFKMKKQRAAKGATIVRISGKTMVDHWGKRNTKL